MRRNEDLEEENPSKGRMRSRMLGARINGRVEFQRRERPLRKTHGERSDDLYDKRIQGASPKLNGGRQGFGRRETPLNHAFAAQ